MATVTGSGTLATSANLKAITGFFEINDGQLDLVSGYIQAYSDDKWAALAGTTWATFNSYTQIFRPIRWTAPEIDLGRNSYFTVSITAEFDGDIRYEIYVSEQPNFQGEESVYYAEDGDLSIPAFYGRYCRVIAICTGRELRRFSIEAQTEPVTYFQPNINTSTLGGSISSRQLVLDRVFSGIADIKIHPQAPTAYNLDVYVTDTPTSQVLIPIILNKNGSPPTFKLVGLDNINRNGTIDVTVQGYPRQAMINGQIFRI
jgi:hypothetical protein